MKNFKLKPVNAAIAAAVAVIGAGALMNGTDNPFGQNDLTDGYQNADGRIAKVDGSGEGKCGEDKEAEGSCGEGHDDAEGKCGEGKCGEGHDKDAEGSCGEEADADAEDKDAEGSCGEEADDEDKDAEGSCGGQ